jgi:hypothetical protein
VPESLWLAASILVSVIGMGWFALAIEAHWQQAFGTDLRVSTRRTLRLLGAVALTLSLAVCFIADHPSMAPLVWFMGLAASALLIAFALAWRPQLLTVLVLRRASAAAARSRST